MRHVFVRYDNMPRRAVGSTVSNQAEAKKIGMASSGRPHSIRERQATSVKMRKVKITRAEHA